MSAGLPTGRRGQVLAVGLVVLALAVLWLGVVSPALGWFAARADLLQQRQMLAEHAAAAVAAIPGLQAQVAESSAAPRAALLDGATEAIASAVLQQRLQEVSDRAGVRLTSAEVLAGEAAGPYRRLRVRAAVTATWPRLVAMLAAIGQATPRVLVDELQLGASRTVASEGAKLLDAQFTAVALYSGRAQ